MPKKCCGAKTRSGGKCKSKPMANGRCRMHGGKSTGPKDQTNNTNAIKHGFYTDVLQPEERVLWERVEIGSIDDEIKLLRIKLRRLVKLSGSEDVADLVDSAIEVAKKRGTGKWIGAFENSEIKVKAPLYSDLIIQALEQLRKLELTRLQMKLANKQLNEGDGAGDEIGRQDTFITPDEDGPAKPVL